MTKMMMQAVQDWWNQRYPEWVPEIALRYLPVVESICAEPSRGLILEVGVNGSGLDDLSSPTCNRSGLCYGCRARAHL